MTTINPQEIFNIKSEADFSKLALDIFHYQATENEVYSEFVRTLRIDHGKITEFSNVPFLPVEFYKSHSIQCGSEKPEIIFSSSGTTGTIQSKHPVKALSIYEGSYRKGFDYFYGNISEYTFLALLPSYQERNGSSLIYMVDDLIKESRNPDSGYFLYNHDDLHSVLLRLKAEKKKTILIGVTYALLDFIEAHSVDFPDLIIMETGGMKGKRKEMIREELHEKLCKGFGVPFIHSEYGMTELLSQGYSTGEGRFNCPPWMRVYIRDTNDPFSLLEAEKTGGINVIDLANLHSCSFLSTQDLGKKHRDGSFEILGRFDNSDIRGCNLLIQ
ncbi:acyl transferase [Pedobacter sp. P351]|uniref:acyl transferase n=1 Tax=Pedobacter superstes TaxID=3133441 RepID=UPI0030991281